MASTVTLHRIDWAAVSRDAVKFRDLKSALRRVLKDKFPREDLLIDDEAVFLLSARKRFKRATNDTDIEACRRFVCLHVIPDHIKYWIERAPEHLIRSLLAA